MRIVLMHPPPSFFAPYPAAKPRNSLLMFYSLSGKQCQVTGDK